jgi:hypothetical protein
MLPFLVLYLTQRRPHLPWLMLAVYGSSLVAAPIFGNLRPCASCASR